jgi:hypothetical protein
MTRRVGNYLFDPPSNGTAETNGESPFLQVATSELGSWTLLKLSGMVHMFMSTNKK